MRWRAALVAALAILGGLVVYAVRPPTEQTAVSPTPTATAIPSTTGSPTAASSPSSSPSAPVVVGAIDIKAHVVSVPRDFRYVATGSKLLLLDLAAGTAKEVASFSVPQSVPGFPRAEVGVSENGTSVLLTVHAPPQGVTSYLLTPETGTVRALVHGEIVAAAISRDGSRLAVGRNDQDPALTGLWVGSTASGSMRRVISDDAQFAGSPPLPYAFSPSGELLAFGLPNGESGAHAGIVSYSSAEGKTDHSAGGWAVTGNDAILLGPSSGAEFIANDELFVWSSRTVFGGQTVAYTYRLASKVTKELYAPAGDVVLMKAAWAPGARAFASAERPICCGVLPLTVRVIAEDGSGRKLGDWSVIDMWWSGTGTSAKLYGILGGDDSTSAVVEMLTNKTAMQFCWRGGSPGSCT
jgi:hypothetical protein